jgi:hypothetical protein
MNSPAVTISSEVSWNLRLDKGHPCGRYHRSEDTIMRSVWTHPYHLEKNEKPNMKKTETVPVENLNLN